ncbi:MAG: hypothetical protein ACREBR_04135, partial [bacterium]
RSLHKDEQRCEVSLDEPNDIFCNGMKYRSDSFTRRRRFWLTNDKQIWRSIQIQRTAKNSDVL